MLEWERTMQNDLSPLFKRIPPTHANTSTSVDTTIASSSASTTSTIPATEEPFGPAAFVDKIVENHDARAVLNSDGEILLLWTFIDRYTLVITTNEYTLREVVSRLANAPVVSIPQ
jgi:hypothetical protein